MKMKTCRKIRSGWRGRERAVFRISGTQAPGFGVAYRRSKTLEGKRPYQTKVY